MEQIAPFVGPFVGRTTLVLTLRDLLEQAAWGRGGLVLLVGDSGSGKTRTANELACYARLRGFEVRWPTDPGGVTASGEPGTPCLRVLDEVGPRLDAGAPLTRAAAAVRGRTSTLAVVTCASAPVGWEGWALAALSLGPLADDDARILVERLLPGAGRRTVDRLVSVSRGNPGRLQARIADRKHWLDHAIREGLGIPRGPRAVVGADRSGAASGRRPPTPRPIA